MPAGTNLSRLISRIVNTSAILSFIVLLLSAGQAIAMTGAVEKSVLIKDDALLPILTPAFAERQTLKIRLKNGLQAYIVSDPNVDQSAAALTVKTGSWEDPQDSPGIAHFLEHMLFLGTKKYPHEAHYCRFITEHGGIYNAFTSNDATSYMFAINNNAFSQAIDCFASFFKEPLFNPSGVDRELQAIDQEYAKNVENDDIRQYFVHKELTDPAHPNHAFSMGNKASLQHVSQAALKKWYKEHYSANRMRLVVIANQPIEKLKELVIEAFDEIPNTDLPPLSVDKPWLSNDLKGHMVYIEPIKNIRRLALIWELPLHFGDMRDTKPENIACYVFGHEGKNSLLAELKRLKLAEGLSCGASKIGDRSYAFNIDIALTDGGVKNVDQVILHCFEAIANFKDKGVPNYLFDEVHTMEKINYQYQTREDAFSHIMKQAHWIAKEELNTYPEQTHVIQRFDPAAVKELLALLTPENCVFDLMAPQSLTGIEYDRKEQWLHAAYTVKAVPRETLQQWSLAAANPHIDLPAFNPFIPDKLSLANPPPAVVETQTHQLPKPTAVVDNDSGKIYFAPDDSYFMPQIFLTFEIKTPSIKASSAESMVLADLYIKNALEALSAYTYPATMAGLDFHIQRTDNGLLIAIDGYSDKADDLFLDLVKELKAFRPDEHQFKVYKDMLLRQYQNFALEKPLSQAAELLKDALFKHYVTEKQKTAAIRKITFKKFEDFAATLFNTTYVEGLMYGNMLKTQAKQLADKLHDTLASQPYPPSEHLAKEVITLPENQGPFIIEAQSKAQGNAVILTIETVPYSFKARAAQQILMQAMREPFFSTLRTKQQTGYIVMSQAEEQELHLFNTFAVQSNTHEGPDLLARFELFIEGFMQEISKSEVTLDRFENIKHALTMTLRQPQKSIAEMGATLNRLAFTYAGDFDWMNKRIQGFEELSYLEFLEYAKEAMGKHNRRRLAIFINGNIPEEGTLRYKKIASAAQLHKLGVYDPAVEMLSQQVE